LKITFYFSGDLFFCFCHEATVFLATIDFMADAMLVRPAVVIVVLLAIIGAVV